MSLPIRIDKVLPPGKEPSYQYLQITWATEKIQSLQDAQHLKRELEVAVRELVMNFEARTGLPVVSLHQHESHIVGTPPLWRATVKLL